MQDNTLQLSNNTATAVPFSKKIPFTKYDFGWVLLCIGMAIGAGTVLMPVQIGLTGIWVFIVAFIIAYPATYICLLYTSPSPRDRQKSRMPSSA